MPTPSESPTPGPSETPTPAPFGSGHVLALPALGLPAIPALDLDREESTITACTYDSDGNRLIEDKSGAPT